MLVRLRRDGRRLARRPRRAPGTRRRSTSRERRRRACSAAAPCSAPGRTPTVERHERDARPAATRWSSAPTAGSRPARSASHREPGGAGRDGPVPWPAGARGADRAAARRRGRPQRRRACATTSSCSPLRPDPADGPGPAVRAARSALVKLFVARRRRRARRPCCAPSSAAPPRRGHRGSPPPRRWRPADGSAARRRRGRCRRRTAR